MKKSYAILVCGVMIALGIAISGCLGPGNNPPTAKIFVSKNFAQVGENITFDGSQSTDDKGISKYEWDFGDGTKGEGKTVVHNYSASGKFTVKLTVTDGDGATNDATTTVSISAPGARVVVEAYPPNALVNDEITFDASRSQDLDKVVSYYWDFGDGTQTNGTAPKIKHAYNTTGDKTVTLFAEYTDQVIGSYSLSVRIGKLDPSIKNASTFVTSTIGEPESLDPAYDYETAGGEIIQNTYETLVTYDGKSADQLVPLLASEMPNVSADGKEITVKLRKGVKFASGREMKADDVIYSFARLVIMADPSGPSWMVEQVTTNYVAQYIGQPIQNWIDDTDGWNAGQSPPQYLIDALGTTDFKQNMTLEHVTKVAFAPFVKVDDYTVKIRLTRPYAAFMYIMAYTATSITDSQLVKDKCGETKVHETCEYMQKNAVAGTGPYVVNEGKWEPGSKITMELNTNWWKESQLGYKRYITKVVIRIDPEYNTRLQLLKNGEADFAAIGWQNKNDVENNPDLRIIKGEPTFTLNFYGLNQNFRNATGTTLPVDFFKNPDARKAFAYAWPYDDFIKNVMNGGGFAPQGPIPKGMFGYREDPNKRYTYNPAKAEEYFKKIDNGSLWDNGFELTLFYNTGNDAREKGCNLFKTSLESLNPKFKINVQGLDWPSYLQKVKMKELPVFFLGWAPDYADPDDYVLPFLHSAKGYFPGRISYKNPQMDDLIDRAASELNKDKRKQLYAQIQDLEFEDAPYIWNFQGTTFHVERTWVVGYFYNPMMSGGWYWGYMKAVV